MTLRTFIAPLDQFRFGFKDLAMYINLDAAVIRK